MCMQNCALSLLWIINHNNINQAMWIESCKNNNLRTTITIICNDTSATYLITYNAAFSISMAPVWTNFNLELPYAWLDFLQETVEVDVGPDIAALLSIPLDQPAQDVVAFHFWVVIIVRLVVRFALGRWLWFHTTWFHRCRVCRWNCSCCCVCCLNCSCCRACCWCFGCCCGCCYAGICYPK